MTLVDAEPQAKMLPRASEIGEASRLGILIVNCHLPVFPGTGGHEYLNTTNLGRLAGQVGLVSMVHTQRDLEKSQRFHEAGVQLYLWESPHIQASSAAPERNDWLKRLHRQLVTASTVIKSLPFRPYDTVVADMNFRNISGPLLTALSGYPWRALVVIQSNAAATINYIPRQLVTALVMHDIRSLVFERQAQVAGSWWRRYQLRRQARRYFHFERAQTRRYDLVVALSNADAGWIREHYQPRRVAVVPVPVDSTYFAPPPAHRGHPRRIVFTGLMNHPPNEDAALFFARDIFPLIRQQIRDAEFFVVGKHPTPDVSALAQLPGVIVTGEVADTRPYLADAAVVVVPLRFGSGVRNKILEAWAMERLVVSTTIGAEGLEYQDGANLAIADDAESMARTVIQAIREPEFRDRLRYAGRAVAVEAHHPQRIAAHYYDQIQAVAAEKARQDVPMRVALDMSWMIPGMAGGLENLARSFMRQLIALDRFNRYTAILPARCRYDFDLRGHDNIRVASRDSLAVYAERVLGRISRAIHGRLHLDYWKSPEVASLLFARALDAQIVYSFPGYIYPDVHSLRHVLMVPDIQHEFFPEFFAEEALAERRRLYGDAVRRADQICAISEFTRRTLIERLGVAPEKISAIPLAADPIFTTCAQPEVDRSRLRKYGLRPGDYLYYPAHTWHHKNHRTAIAALRILRDKHGLAPALVCTGGAREAQPAIEEQIAASGLQGQVRFLGYCPHEDIPALYRGAAGLLFPSLFEGFGMPVLEAMASGCAVVCSNTTSLPEIAGDAALLADPADAEAFADAIALLLRKDELRADLRERGLRQAARFSWRRHTLETIGVFYRLHRQLREL